jgi:hypothetical protein
MNRAALIASAGLAVFLSLPGCPPPKPPTKDIASLVDAAKTRAGARGILLSFAQTTDALAKSCIAASHVVEATEGRPSAFDLITKCEEGTVLIRASLLPAAKAVDLADDDQSTLNIVACVAQDILSQNGLVTKVVQLVSPAPPTVILDGLNVAKVLADYASTCKPDGGK